MPETNKKILVVFAHPALEESRVNRNILELLSVMEDVTVRDLYELYPDYEIDRQEEQIALIEHDILIWMHPFYWYSAPPMLKHWIDEVLEFNWAYGPNGLMLKNKWAMNLISTGGAIDAYRSEGSNHYSVREFLRPFEQTARLCGMEYLAPFAIMGSYRLTRDIMEEYLMDLKFCLEELQAGNVSMAEMRDRSFFNEIKILE